MIDAIQPQHGDKHAKDSEATDKPKRIKYLGLSNQGATCYMNSFLQSLFMTPEFRNAIYSWEYSDKEQVKSEDCIPLQLQLLFAKLQTFKEQDYLDTKSLIRSFQWDPEESFKQHDVQEFSAVLFDAIEESFRGSKQEFFIRDLFQGSSLGYVKCRKCLNESLNEDMFLYLSLTVKDDFEKVYNPTVDKGIENYLKPFILEGDNKYFCEKCQAKVEAEKGVKFATLPKILTIHLNRFDMDYTTMSRRKLNNKVTFPFTLNMNKFLKPYEEIAAENSKNPENKTIEINEVNEKKESGVNVDEEIWYNYQTEAFKLSENKGRRSKKPAVTFEDYEDFLSKKVISPETNNSNSGLNLMVSNRNDNLSVEDKSLTRTHQKAVLQETLASLKQSQKELDKKLNKLPKTNPAAQVDQSDFPLPKQQIDIDELTGLEMLLLNNASEGPKSTEDTSKSIASNNFELSSERGTSPGKSVINEETDLITRELRQCEKEQKGLFERYIAEGDQVYELYSIMIHSGSAWGGHYYTYIKSFEDGQWYNFDDRNVIRMSVKEIEKVFGDEVPNKNGGCSAYMLMYRLYDRDQHRDGFTIEDMPKSTKQVIEAERIEEIRKAEEERRKKEEKEKEIILRVFYKGSEQMVTAKKDDTFEDLVRQIQQECDVTEDSQSFRVRNFSVAEALMQETYDEQDQKKTLEQLRFKSYKSLVVETKEEGENWVGYDPNKILVKINLWRPNLFDLEESCLKPSRLLIEEGSTLKDLVKAIEEKFKIAADKQIIIKRNALGGRGLSDILNKDESSLDKNLMFHRIFNGLNLYVEERTVPEGEQTKWDKEFESEKHRCTIKFNNPLKDIEGQNPFYDSEIIVDSRSLLFDLKKLIAEILNIEMDTFIMKKNGPLGAELHDLKKKLVDFNINGCVHVFIRLGTPAKSGEYKIIFCTCSLQTENNDGLNFDYVDLFSLQLGNREKVSDVKEKLVAKLAECKPPIDITPQTMRLRERNALHLGQILHDNNYMKDYSLFDNKAIVIEKLDTPTTDDPSKIMIYLRYLDTEKFELLAPIQIFVQKEKTTLHGVGVEVAKVLNIPLEQVECFKVQSLYSFTRTDLLTANWVTLQGNGYLLSSSPWYLIKDGNLLIIKKKDDKIDLEKVKNMKLKTNKKMLKAGEEKMPVSSMLMPKETSMKIMVKKRSDITKTQDDTDCGKKGESVIEKQKRPHEV